MAVLDEKGLATLIQKIHDADQEIKNNIPQASNQKPKPSGTAAEGTSDLYARADHVHPYADAKKIIGWIVTAEEENNSKLFFQVHLVSDDNDINNNPSIYHPLESEAKRLMSLIPQSTEESSSKVYVFGNGYFYDQTGATLSFIDELVLQRINNEIKIVEGGEKVNLTNVTITELYTF